MRHLRNSCIALFLACCVPLLIWAGACSALYQRKREINLLKRALPDLSCHIDTDCPPGFMCIAGRCVPER